MSDASKRFTKEQIDKITFQISSLDSAQRETVRAHLHHMHDINDGLFYKESFKRDLYELRTSNDISETDYHAVLKAFFG